MAFLARVRFLIAWAIVPLEREIPAASEQSCLFSDGAEHRDGGARYAGQDQEWYQDRVENPGCHRGCSYQCNTEFEQRERRYPFSERLIEATRAISREGSMPTLRMQHPFRDSAKRAVFR